MASRRILALWYAGLVAAAVCLAWSGQARAQSRVKAEVKVIYAKRGPPYLHPDLKSAWKILKRAFGPRFAYYDLVKSQSQVLGRGKAMVVKLPDKGEATLTYRGVSRKDGMIEVTLDTGTLATNVRVADGGVFFQAGQQYKSGVLVISVRLQLLKD